MMRRTATRARAMGVLLMLLLAPVALASGSGSLAGQNGHLATCLFDVQDLLAHEDWDRSRGHIGNRSWYLGIHTVAADAAGTAYVMVFADDYEDVGTLVGVVSMDSSGDLETVLQYEYDGGGAFLFPEAIGIATFSVGSGDARIDAGDIVMLSRSLRDYDTPDEAYGTLIQAFDPEDASGTMRTLYESETFEARTIILDPTTKSLVLPRGSTLERISYDANEGESGGFVSATMQVEPSPNTHGYSIWAIDNNGDLYADTSDRVVLPSTQENFDWVISRFDGETGDLLDLEYANPTGAPKAWGSHRIGGFTFDSKGKLWLADFKNGKSPPYFISKANKKGKFPYKKRIAEWGVEDSARVRDLQSGHDGLLYAVVRVSDDDYSVWAID